MAAADVVSTTGSEMTAVALPWFVLVSTGSPARMGAVLAAEFVGMTVLGLWGGRLTDVLGPRRMMLVSDAARAVLIGSIPVLHWAGALSLPVLLATGFTVGAFFPGYSSAQRLVLARLVGDDELRLTRAGGLLSSANELASFAGPALAGVLIVLVGSAAVLVIDAGSYLVAFLLVAALVPAARGAAEPTGPVARSAAEPAGPGAAPAGPGAAPTGPATERAGGVVEGLRYVARHPVLRRQVVGIGLIEVGWTAMVATLPVLALHGGGASVAGWLLASYGAGSVVGGLISARARNTGGPTAAWALVGIAASTWLLLVPAPWWVRAGAVAANGVCAGLYFPRFFSALTTGTPPALRARVMTSVTIAISAPGPVGFLGAGLLVQHTGSTTPALLLVAVAATLGAAVAVGCQNRRVAAPRT